MIKHVTHVLISGLVSPLGSGLARTASFLCTWERGQKKGKKGERRVRSLVLREERREENGIERGGEGRKKGGW